MRKHSIQSVLECTLFTLREGDTRMLMGQGSGIVMAMMAVVA